MNQCADIMLKTTKSLSQYYSESIFCQEEIKYIIITFLHCPQNGLFSVNIESGKIAQESKLKYMFENLFSALDSLFPSSASALKHDLIKCTHTHTHPSENCTQIFIATLFVIAKVNG